MLSIRITERHFPFSDCGSSLLDWILKASFKPKNEKARSYVGDGRVRTHDLWQVQSVLSTTLHALDPHWHNASLYTLELVLIAS